MARPIRLQLAGAHYLVTARAASPDCLFTDEQDRACFIEAVERSCTRYRWRVVAWCLGIDHYQLLLVTERPNLAAGVRHLNSVHSQRLHRQRRARGELFDGRYASVIVDPARSLFIATADVLLAPVRSGLVADVADWPWSSWHATTAADPAPAWLAVRELLQPFDDDATLAAAGFTAALRALPPPVDDPDAPPKIYADAEYIAKLVASNVPSEDEDRIVFGRLRPALRDLAAIHPDRHAAMREAYRVGYSQKEIARYFNVHTATVSRAVAAGSNWPRITSPLIAALRYVHD
ncbi:MAG: transposase [Acidobacteria bacterium]|nr:transposase [Acidobacteriota bacterium]